VLRVINPMLTKARMRGIIGGAAILTLFGGLWFILTLVFQPARSAWTIPAASVTTFVLLVVCVLRWAASANMPDSHDPAATAKGKRAGMIFGIIFGLEGGLIALVSVLLGRSSLGDWIPVAVALIVGVHFIPLAYVFEMPVYYWTGGLSILGILGCLLIHGVGPRLLCVGMVMGTALWSTTLLLLVRTRSS
jgi:hypothetical protein